MKNLRLALKSVVESRADVADQLTQAGDAVLIKRGQPRWLLLKCPCGCGDEIPVNLDHRAGKAWRYYRDARSQVTVFPSIWRDTGCKSHFIIWRDQILIFGGDDDDISSSPVHPDLPALAARILESWPAAAWCLYADVADAMGEIPWDVLDACRYLARRDSLIEGRGQRRGMFRRS